MRVLVTNDDGIEAEGMHALARALEREGYEVLVVAPAADRSGAGAAIGLLHLDQHLDVRPVGIPDCDAEAFALDGPPGMCVVAARLGAFGEPPKVVAAGINAGLNTGRAILHSGTVGAALTAQNFGASALAVSLESGDSWPWADAARVAADVIGRLHDAPARTVLNLNVPNRPYDEIGAVRWARLAAFGAVRAAIAESSDGRLQFELRATGIEPPADSDQAVVEAGDASLTTLVGIAEAWPPDGHDDVDVAERIVPGAPLEPVHSIPDASQPRWLHRPQAAPAVPDDQRAATGTEPGSRA